MSNKQTAPIFKNNVSLFQTARHKQAEKQHSTYKVSVLCAYSAINDSAKAL